MLRCKQVADALADERYWNLPWYRRWGLRLHVGLCLFCGRYHRHVMCMQEMADEFNKHTEDAAKDVHLSDEARDRIREACKRDA